MDERDALLTCLQCGKDMPVGQEMRWAHARVDGDPDLPADASDFLMGAVHPECWDAFAAKLATRHDAPSADF